MKSEIKRKLTSRKFWMAVCSFVTMLMLHYGHTESEAAQVASLIMAGATVIGYIIGEGLADAGMHVVDFSGVETEEETDEEAGQK